MPVNRRAIRVVAAAASAVAATLGMTGAPAMASGTHSFSATTSPYDGDVSGTVTAISSYKISVTAHLWNETGVQLGWQICWGYYGANSDNEQAGCNSMRYNNRPNTMSTWSNLTYSDPNARIEWATIAIYKNGSLADAAVIWAM